VRSELRNLQKNVGITTLFVTHDQTEALSMSDRVAVMREGVIVQEAPPREIYSRPVDPYVADFLGRINSFDAIVDTADTAGNIVVQVGPARLSVCSKARVAWGKKVMLAIRPENMRLSDAASEARNGLKGTVAEASFLGDAVDYRVIVDGKPVIVKETPKVPFSVGARVRIEFDSADGLIYADDAG
jgi:iron(III) transport system ATP-binding protein